MITVNAELARQGVISDTLSLMEIASHAAVGAVTTYAARLSDLATRRRFWEIAKKLNISRSYVSRIEKSALEKLRKQF